jgi:hypothetical protein
VLAMIEPRLTVFIAATVKPDVARIEISSAEQAII